MSFGWGGKIIRVDLTRKEIGFERTEQYREYIGGSGLGTKILYNEVPPDITAADPENRLILAAGPLTGTLVPGSGRLSVLNKSPHTGGFADSSSGGHWAPELKYAGYDAVVFQGKADSPVYLLIDDDEIQLKDATHLWGKTTWETEELIQEELNNPAVQVICIGPAGENLVRYACMINNLTRAPGWGGNGLVAGSKNLKAVVVKGTKGIDIWNPKEFRNAAQEYFQSVKNLPMFEAYSRYGWPILTDLFQMPFASGDTGSNCLYNMKKAKIPSELFEKVRPETMCKDLVIKSKACFACPMHCSHYMAVKEGEYAGTESEGWEWNAMGESFKMGIFDLNFTTRYNQRCNQLGLDIDGPGGAIAWAMECYENGLLSDRDTGGIHLDWGNKRSVLELIELIAKREGFGEVLADGPVDAAKRLGKESERYAHEGKGRSHWHWDHRWAYGYLLGGAVSTRGPDHLKGCGLIEFGIYPPDYIKQLGFAPEAAMPTVPKNKKKLKTWMEQKAKITEWFEYLSILCDSLTICKNITHFYTGTMAINDFARLVYLATGWQVDKEKLTQCAERINNVQKAFNVRCGVGSREEDKLPRRFYEDPIETDLPLASKDVFEKLKDYYYRLKGWDVKTGFPTKQRLASLGLQQVADDLEVIGRCGNR